MSVGILWCCIIIVLQYTSAYIANTNVGTHFAVACPWSLACYAHVSTEEQRVLVIVNLLQREKTQLHHVGRWAAMVVTILKPNDNIDARQASGILNVTSLIKASGGIRVLVTTQSANQWAGDGFVLIPKKSCHKSYHIIAVHGHPFIVVVAFNHPHTHVNVVFPHMEHAFSTKCTATQVCLSGGMAKVVLEAYQAWYLTVSGQSYNLLDTRIKADQPIFVVAGTHSATYSKSNTVTRFSASFMKPLVSWGKTYIVPHIVDGEKSFCASSLFHPFHLEFHEKGKTVKKQTFQHQDGIYVYGWTKSTIAITSKFPFGLYQIIQFKSGDTDASILNLIPVEQWLDGQFYVDPNIGNRLFHFKYLLITELPQEDVVLPDVTNAKVDWHEETVSVNRKHYFVGEVNLTGVDNLILYTNHYYTRRILYVIAIPKGNHYSNFLSFPYEFYQAKLYMKDCLPSITTIPNDGIDNDCDGRVDEEIENGRDDDGDNRVDEDTTYTHVDGHWSQWVELCNVTCSHKTLEVRTRACLDKSPHGQPCLGESIQCDGGVCPEDCEDGKSRSYSDCYCDAGCKTCSRSVFQCDSCKSGYTPTNHCTSICPPGWTGYGCMDIIYSSMTQGSPHRHETPKPTMYEALATLVYLVVVAATITAFIVHWKSVEQKENEYEKEEGELDRSMLPPMSTVV